MIDELKETLSHIRDELNQAIAIKEDHEIKYKKANLKARECSRIAYLSLKKSNDEVARKALHLKRDYVKIANHSKLIIKEKEHLIEEFNEFLVKLDIKLIEAISRRIIY